MNSISPKRPEINAEDQILDVTIPAAELARLYEERKREAGREAQRARVKRMLNGAVIAGLVTTVGVLGSAVAIMLPLKEIVTVVVYQRDDGTYTNYALWDALPEKVRNDTTVNVVWNYVQQRESWSDANAGHAWTMVSAMSSPNVRESFQTDYGNANPQSPARVYGENTVVDVRFINWAPVCAMGEDYCADAPPAYRIWFDRIEKPKGGDPKPPVRYAATVRILRNVKVPTDRLWQRWTFNAPQIQVIEYPGAQKEGVSK